MIKKLIILDRDGVINRDLGTYVTHPDEFEFIDGAIDAIAALKKVGFKVAITTNQAGIERGFYNHKILSAIHAKMLRIIRAQGGDIERIIYCPSYDDAHPWRKPNAGMLTELLNGFKIAPENAVFIGDAVRDMQAGRTADCHLMILTSEYGKSDYHDLPDNLKSRVRLFPDLLAAAQQLILEKEY